MVSKQRREDPILDGVTKMQKDQQRLNQRRIQTKQTLDRLQRQQSRKPDVL